MSQIEACFLKAFVLREPTDRPLELNTERNSAIPIRDPFDSWIVALIYSFGIFWRSCVQKDKLSSIEFQTSGYDAEHMHSTLVDHSEACSEWNLSC